MSALQVAFDAFRDEFRPPAPPRPEFIRNQDECRQMTQEDGIREFNDGPSADVNVSEAEIAIMALMEGRPLDLHLWVVMQDKVPYANENCDFGRSLESGRVTHTNITGGAEAYCGGEVLLLGEGTLVINGKSGRYPVRSSNQMDAVAKAFSKAGYNVWSMGYDPEAARPLPFGATIPRLVR